MNEDQVSKYLSDIGKKGGHARAKRLTPEEHTEISKKAGKASGKARSKNAKKKRQG
jgi:general stress protein YciG